jgi:hypothetical protein
MTAGGDCSIQVPVCEHADLEDISFTIRVGEQWRVDHDWMFQSIWTTGPGCAFSDNVCAIDGQVWVTSCRDASASFAEGNVLESTIDCGTTVVHGCP